MRSRTSSTAWPHSLAAAFAVGPQLRVRFVPAAALLAAGCADRAPAEGTEARRRHVRLFYSACNEVLVAVMSGFPPPLAGSGKGGLFARMILARPPAFISWMEVGEHGCYREGNFPAPFPTSSCWGDSRGTVIDPSG
jgi:hypothetical protein